MAKRPGNAGAVVLWLVMFALLGVAGTEFYGPTQGWLKPSIASVKTKVLGMKSEYDEELRRKKERLAAEAQAREEAIAQQKAIIESGRDSFEPSVSSAPSDPTTGGTDQPPVNTSTNAGADAVASSSNKFDVDSVISKYSPEQLMPGQPGYDSAFEEIWHGKVEELSKPEVGKSYKIRTRKKEKFQGSLLVLMKNKAVFKDGKQQDVVFTDKDLSIRSLKSIFPERYAKKYAEYHLAKTVAAAGLHEKKQEPVEPSHTTPDGPGIEKPPVHTTIAKLPPLKRYDPTYAATPKHLGGPLKEFHTWLDYQNRRLKYRLATKLYAKQHGKDIVLYIETSKSFRMQPNEARSVYCDSFWKMWARKLREQGRVPAEKNAHIVLLDDRGKIIGGSKLKDSGNTWVK